MSDTNKAATGMVLGILFAALPMAAGQSQTKTSSGAQVNADANDAAQPQKLTGCIRRGDAVDDYKFMTPDGSEWNIVAGTPDQSQKIKVGSYVDREVAVTGKVAPNPLDAKKEATGQPEKSGRNINAGTLAIKTIKVVKKSCT